MPVSSAETNTENEVSLRTIQHSCGQNLCCVDPILSIVNQIIIIAATETNTEYLQNTKIFKDEMWVENFVTR